MPRCPLLTSICCGHPFAPLSWERKHRDRYRKWNRSSKNRPYIVPSKNLGYVYGMPHGHARDYLVRCKAFPFLPPGHYGGPQVHFCLGPLPSSVFFIEQTCCDDHHLRSVYSAAGLKRWLPIPRSLLPFRVRFIGLRRPEQSSQTSRFGYLLLGSPLRERPIDQGLAMVALVGDNATGMVCLGHLGVLGEALDSGHPDLPVRQ